jgi:hypothetical protein
MECPDCFFQSGRSYLDLEADLPNMPDEVKPWQIVRVNDGNDSNHQRGEVIKATRRFPLRFYNTSRPWDLAGFREPVVLTVNPAGMTDREFHRLVEGIPRNLMFVRIRTNVWNLNDVVEPAVEYYTSQDVPVVLTFMAYHSENGVKLKQYYEYRKRTSNPYWAIKTDAWRDTMWRYKDNPLVYSCGREGLTTACERCGNCVREFMRTKERLNQDALREE